MHSRLLTIPELTMSLVFTVITITALRAWACQADKPLDKHMPITIEPLPRDNGVSPVGVQCEDAHLTTPNVLEEFSCTVINNTGKNISALSAALTVITETESGGLSRNADLCSLDSLIHPGVRTADNI